MSGYRENFKLTNGQTDKWTENGHSIGLSIYGRPITLSAVIIN